MKQSVPPSYLDKKRITDSFRSSGSSYEDNAVVQRAIGTRLLDLVGQYVGEGVLSRVLEIGCGTGILTEDLCHRLKLDTVYLNDIVKEFCDRSKKRIDLLVNEAVAIPGDIENIELPGELDLITSSATLQWVNDLPALMTRSALALRQGGVLAFSILGPGTMHEIHSLTGQGLRYHQRESLQKMLPDELEVLHLDSHSQRLWFDRGRDVLRHIRLTGVGGVSEKRGKRLGLKEFERQYKRQFGSHKGVSVTYVATFVVARKKVVDPDG